MLECECGSEKFYSYVNEIHTATNIVDQDGNFLEFLESEFSQQFDHDNDIEYVCYECSKDIIPYDDDTPKGKELSLAELINKQSSIKQPPITIKCTCNMMTTGCICGAMEQERNKKKT